MRKVAQHTKFDKAKPYNYYSNHNRPKNEVLPFEDWNTKWDMEQSQSGLERQRHEENEERTSTEGQPLNINYPELGPEYFRYRRLSPEDKIRLQQEDEKERAERQRYYYGKPEDKDTPSNKSIYDLDEQLSPEEAKKKIYERYQKFREVAAKFYTYYREANEFVENYTPISLDVPYLQIIKDFPKYLLSLVKREVGQLFGLVAEGRPYHHTDRARKLYEFINRGINVFNVTPETYDEKMKELAAAMHQMKIIMEAYDKRKKVLDKLPLILQQASKEYLAKTKNREFLKWMEEYFPNDKKDFIEESIRNITDTYRYKSQERNYFTIGDLHKIRSYKSVYDKASKAAGPFVVDRLRDKATAEITKRLSEEMSRRVLGKINTLGVLVRDLAWPEQGEDISMEMLRPLYVYCNKVLKLDLKSILSFTESLSENYYKEKYESEWLEEHNIFKVQRRRFIRTFVENIDEAVKKEHGRYRFEEAIRSFVRRLLLANTKDNVLQSKSLENITEKDLDGYVNGYVREMVVDALPNFSTESCDKEAFKNKTPFPAMSALGDIIKETGKFTVDGVLTYITKAAPFIPRELALHLARYLFKSSQSPEAQKVLTSLSEIQKLSDSRSVYTMKVLLSILEKSGKLNPNSFVTAFSDHFQELKNSVYKFKQDIPNKFNDKQVIEIFLTAIRSAATIGQDLKNLNQFVSFIHNDADDLSARDIMMIMKNINFHSFAKLGIVKKIISAYSTIKDQGGVSAIKKKYNSIINNMIKGNYISQNFYQNILLVNNFFNSNQPINPSSEMFQQLFQAASSIETDLEIIEMGETFKELTQDYEKKDERLFNLNLPVGNNLRFRVLKDMDPRTLRIGIETGCCQRIGGAAESAAKDSFVNPLAGVVILEWKDPSDDWKLLSQSYFHYVPPEEPKPQDPGKREMVEESTIPGLPQETNGNGYILDNIETNQANVKESGVDLSSAYAYLANYVRSKFGIKYFLAGKGYSKINTSNFETHSMEDGDPRTFSEKAKGGYRSTVYTDFSPYGSMNLLEPKDPEALKNFKASIGESEETEKKAFLFNLRRIVLGSINISVL